MPVQRSTRFGAGSRLLPSSVKHMSDLSTRSLLVLAVALIVPAMASVWLMAVPPAMTSSTYSIGAILLVALAAALLVSHRGRLSDETVASAPATSTATPHHVSDRSLRP